jgi:TP901 family phage tail tape measure protein
MFGSKRVIEVIINAKENAGPAFDKLKTKVGGLVKSKALLATAAAAAGAAIAAMAVKSVRAYNQAIDAAGRYQEKVLEIATLTGANAQESAALSKELQKLAVKYGQVDKVMAQAQYNIVSAGFGDMADSMKIMEVASKAAIGGVTDVNTAVKVITQTLNAYGKGADEADDIAASLFATVKGGVTTFSELSASLGEVTGTAATAGISFEEVSAAMAIMTKNGINTSQSSTALNALILALGAASGESKKKLNDLGINLKNGLGPALEGISKASEGSLEQLVELIPNIRAIKAAAAAAKNDGQDFAEQLGAMASGADDFNNAYNIMAAGFQQASDRNTAAQERLKNAFGSTGLEGKQVFLDLYAEGLEFLSEIVEENSEGLKTFANGIGKVAGEFIKASAAAAGFVHWVGEQLNTVLTSTVGDLVDLEEQAGKTEAALSDPRIDPSGWQIPGSIDFPETEVEKLIRERMEKAASIEAEASKKATEVELLRVEAREKTITETVIREQEKRMASALKLAEATKQTDAAEDGTDILNRELMLIDDIMEVEALRAEQAMGYNESRGAALLAVDESIREENRLIEEQLQLYDDQIAAQEKLESQAMAVGDAAYRVGDATAQAFLRGENTMKAFANAIRTEVITAISAAIAKMLALKAISAFMNVFGGVKDVFGGVKDGGTIPAMASGGSIPGAAFGYAVPDGPRGQDSVLINAMPGEEVINRSLSQRLAGYLASREDSAMADPSMLGGSSGSGAVVSLNIARPVSHLDMMDLGRAAVMAGEQVAEANL